MLFSLVQLANNIQEDTWVLKHIITSSVS